MAWFESDISSGGESEEEDEVSEELEAECIELLDDDDDDEQQQQEEEEDEDIEAIEILSSDLEDDDVVLQGVTYRQEAAASDPQQPLRAPLYHVERVAPIGSLHAPAAAAAAGSSHAGAAASAALVARMRAAAMAAAAAAAVPLPDDDDDPPSPPLKKQRRCSVLDLCGSQLKTYQEELPVQREVYNMYVDGSYRSHWPCTLQMSAGGFGRCPPRCGKRATAGWFNFSLLLVGGACGSMPAELGAIYIGCSRLQDAIAAGSIDPASSEVHMHTDCQGAANMLKRKGARVPRGMAPLITGIKARLRELKQHMPVRLKWVKGHQKGAPTEHGAGNNEAHTRAQPDSLEGAEQLPTSAQGEVVPGEASLQAAWGLFVAVRECGKQRQPRHDRRMKVGKVARLLGAKKLGAQLKRSGKQKGQQKPPKQLPRKLTAAEKAAARLLRAADQQALEQAQGAGAGAGAAGVAAPGAAAAAAAAAGPPPVAAAAAADAPPPPPPPPPPPAAAAADPKLLRQQMLVHTAPPARKGPFTLFGLQFTPAPAAAAAPAAGPLPPRGMVSQAPAAAPAAAAAAPGRAAPLVSGLPGPTQAGSHFALPWWHQVPGAAAAPSTLPGAAAAGGGAPSSLPGATAAAPGTLPGAAAAAGRSLGTLPGGAAAGRAPGTLPGAAAAAAPSIQLVGLQQPWPPAYTLLPSASPDSTPPASPEHAAAAPPDKVGAAASVERVPVICIDC